MNQIDNEKTLFDAWAESHLFDITKNESGRYLSKETRCAWSAWLGAKGLM